MYLLFILPNNCFLVAEAKTENDGFLDTLAATIINNIQVSVNV